MAKPTTAILGWGSLIWDLGYLKDHVKTPWIEDGPALPIEFSRISQSRKGALTLVIDSDHGKMVSTFFILSNRTNPHDVACDLRTREGTIIDRIGLFIVKENIVRSRDEKITSIINTWVKDKNIDAVVWTDLASNFFKEQGKKYSISNAIEYLRNLPEDGKKEAHEYINKTPPQITTQLREALKDENWWTTLRF